VPALNVHGQTAFGAHVTGAGGSSGGIWKEANETLTIVAKSGDQAPGVPAGVIFGGLQTPILNSQGQIAFFGTLTGNGVTTSNDGGIWSDGSGSLALVVREGAQAPGTPSGTEFIFTNFSGPVFNSSGQTAFYSRLEGSSAAAGKDGLWSERNGALSLIALAGEAAPGTPVGVNFVGDFSLPVLNSVGQTVFRDRLTGNVTTNDNSGVWSERSGPLSLLIRQGDPAPGIFPTVSFIGGFPSRFGIDSAGHSAFSAALSDSGGFNTYGSVWSDRSGSLELLVRADEPAPGTAAGHNFYGEIQDIVMNGGGRVAFKWETGQDPAGMLSEGVWSDGNGELSLIALEGQQAPGAPAGVLFGTFGEPALNAAGRVAFLATVHSSDPRSNHSGIWAEDPTGLLQLIARVGDDLEVTPNEFRTISSLGFIGGSGNDDGRRSGFNDRGQVAFYAWFTDGSRGVFVSNIAAVPEPSAMLLLLLAFVALAHRPFHSGQIKGYLNK
jgi:hypothetical protein